MKKIWFPRSSVGTYGISSPVIYLISMAGTPEGIALLYPIALPERLMTFYFIFLVGIGAGIIYRIDDIVNYLQRLGEQSVQFLLILICTTLGIGTLFGLTWMIFTYKLKKKSMEYEFKTHVMDKFGIAVLENNTMLTRSGHLITHENSVPNALEDVKQLTQAQDLNENI